MLFKRLASIFGTIFGAIFAAILVMNAGCSDGVQPVTGDIQVFNDIQYTDSIIIITPDGATGDAPSIDALPDILPDALPGNDWPFELGNEQVYIDDDQGEPLDPFRITGILDIQGTAGVGETLTLGELIPQGAIAKYQWLRGKEVDGFYELINGASEKTYQVTEQDGARYLKVRAFGVGDYYGLIQSNPTARVKSSNTNLTITDKARILGVVEDQIMVLSRLKGQYLLDVIESEDGSDQEHSLTDSSGNPKQVNLSLNTGDKLLVTSELGNTRTYQITLTEPNIFMIGGKRVVMGIDDLGDFPGLGWDKVNKTVILDGYNGPEIHEYYPQDLDLPSTRSISIWVENDSFINGGDHNALDFNSGITIKGKVSAALTISSMGNCASAGELKLTDTKLKVLLNHSIDNNKKTKDTWAITKGVTVNGHGSITIEAKKSVKLEGNIYGIKGVLTLQDTASAKIDLVSVSDETINIFGTENLTLMGQGSCIISTNGAGIGLLQAVQNTPRHIPTGYSFDGAWDSEYVAYTLDGKVAPPSITPGGGIYLSPTEVFISTSTPGATIRYTLDGSEPTPDTGLIYNAQFIPIKEHTQIRAIAYKEDMAPSQVATETYIFTLPPPLIQRIGGGSFDTKEGEIKVEFLGIGKPGEIIYYRTSAMERFRPYLDEPIVITNPLAVTAGTIEAYSRAPNYMQSELATQEYKLTLGGITMTPESNQEPHLWPQTITVEITAETESATIVYTLNGETPTLKSPLFIYDGPFSVGKNVTVKAATINWLNWDVTSNDDTRIYKFRAVPPAFGDLPFYDSQPQDLLLTSEMPGASV